MNDNLYTVTMQKIATQVFIYASIVFGVIGILIVLTSSGVDTPDSKITQILVKSLFVTICIILSSFALSIAGKYLNK